jgi:hypothetical protein
MRKGLLAAACAVAVTGAVVAAVPVGAGARPVAHAAAGCKVVHQTQRKTAVYSFVEHLQRATDYGSGNIPRVARTHRGRV